MQTAAKWVKKYSSAQLPFNITPEQAERIEITDEPVGISVFAKRVEAVLDEGVKKLPATHITAWLCDNGCLIEETAHGKERKISTAKGEQLGIITLDGVSRDGMPYRKNVYTADAQRFLVANLNIIASKQQ